MLVKGLDAILLEARPREEQYPTKKQLDFVREKLGEDELDRILMTNLNRGQVTEIIGKYIEENNRSSYPRFTSHGTSSFTERPFSKKRNSIPRYYWGDDGDVGGSGGGWGLDEVYGGDHTW